MSDPEASDPTALVRCACKGDSRAFAELVKRHRRLLLTVAFGILGNADEAVDVVQESWIKAYQALDRLQDPARFSAWLVTIVRTTATDHVRRRVRWGTREVLLPGEDLPEGGLDADGLQRHEIGPVERLEHEEESQRIRDALIALSPEYREVLLMKHQEGMSYRTMAGVLGTTEKAVESRLFRARQQLGRLLGRHRDEPGDDPENSVSERAAGRYEPRARSNAADDEFTSSADDESGR